MNHNFQQDEVKKGVTVGKLFVVEKRKADFSSIFLGFPSFHFPFTLI